MSDFTAPTEPAAPLAAPPFVATSEPEPAGSSAPGERPAPDWEADAALIDSLGGEFDRVEAALRRLDTPAAGRCEACGAEINPSDLVADPVRTRCPAHAA